VLNSALSLLALALAIVLTGLLLATGVRAADCPGADAEALSWLDRMSRSMNQVSYHGVVTLQRNGDMQVMHVSHEVADDNSTERLTQLTGQGAQVKRGSHPLECIHPGHQLLRIGAELQTGHCGIAEHYRLSVSGVERVAGRKSVLIRIQPRDMYRFGYVMALDRETGLLLKTETLGRGDKSLEKFQFANLSYTDNLPGAADVDVIHEAHHPHPATPDVKNGVGRGWSVGWVPRGFTPTDSPDAHAARRTFTDGLAVFSVFLEHLDNGIRPGEGIVREGGTTAYTRGMQLDEDAVLVTVIGEVPVNTARMVADKIVWTQ
jgi:sigma-E factor negative regulatory protein RseB